ncbi:MAG: EpsG family protein [Prevotella sp.]|nr:EpsG family protein [Prevotella sp.]
MSIFYLLFILLTIYYSIRYDGIEEYDSHKQHRLWLMCGFMICLTGFSYGLGADKFTYMEEFELYPNTFFEAEEYILSGLVMRGQMPLWTIINLLCKNLFDSFYAVQLLESAAINIAVCYIVSKYTHRYFLFILIYFFSLKYFIFNCEVMREGFAIALVLFGIHGYMNGRKWLFFVLLSVALMFHVSAFIAILFPFIRFRLSWKTLYITIILSFVFWLASDFIMGKVLSLAFGGEGAFAQKVMFYSLQASSFFGYLRYLLTYLVFPYIVMYYMILNEPSEEKRKQKEKLTCFMVALAIIAIAIYPLARFYNYVQIFYLIMFADFLFTLFRSYEHLIIRIGTGIGTILLMFWFYFSHYETTNTYYYDFFYPYTCILHEDKSVFFRSIAHDEAVNPQVTDKNTRDIE